LDFVNEAGRGVHGSQEIGRVSNPFLDLHAHRALLPLRAGAKGATDAARIRRRHLLDYLST